ncbi:MAG: alanine--tRNA ligase [Rhodospirillales bacterium]|nr:alanine--tRNA ligase [Rhodospirillales bacterium]
MTNLAEKQDMQTLTPDELRHSYLNHMKKACGSVTVPSASLLPENDPSTLFTGSGMQPMVPYLLGEKHPSGNDIANIQKCVRTIDIDEVGDNSHLTFFEMIGRWELGADPADYKQKQIEAIWDWQVNVLGLDPARLYVSVYQGNAELDIPKDDTAIATWSKLFRSVGIDPAVEEDPWTYGASRGGRIFMYDEGENWWSRVGGPKNMPVGEPGGPDSEMFFDFAPKGDPKDHPATDTPRFLEIGNNVFMSHKREESGFAPLKKPNIDYGGGLERVAAALNGDPDIYLTAFFATPIRKLSELTGTTYTAATRDFRIILDHTRAATFLIADGAVPSNVDAGYITRRIMRRAIRVARKLGIHGKFMGQISEIFIDEATAYPEVIAAKAKILMAVEAEEDKFQKTLQSGEREIQKHLQQRDQVTGEDAFYFYETYGFPMEVTREVLQEQGKTILAPEGFDSAMKRHADLSRTAAAGKFQGGLADHSEKTTALHSAAHLMLAGLRTVLGTHVHQKGSNITPERIRFDFSHDAKMTEEEKQAVEAYVNAAITSNAPMTMREMPKEDAMAQGIEGSFWEKYPDIVKVYVFEDAQGKVWSAELCGGPHAENTGVLGQYGTFRIQKEESSSAGVRRVKAVLE